MNELPNSMDETGLPIPHAGGPPPQAPDGRSSLYLPPLRPTPATILEYLHARFPHVGLETWRSRMADGLVCTDDGDPVTPRTPYTPHLTVRYSREVVGEPAIPFAETILYQDADLLVADKPHFLPVVPAGPYVRECLLARLQRRTGIADLAPAHRLDRETAGLVLFSVRRATRVACHRLFAERAIVKEYMAVVLAGCELPDRFQIIGDVVAGDPWFRMAVPDVGLRPPEAVVANTASTQAEILQRDGARMLLRLRPHTGRKHQIRAHLAAIGCPIRNDRLYPTAQPFDPYNFDRPLQLLASRLAFTDPVSGAAMEFHSARHLDW